MAIREEPGTSARTGKAPRAPAPEAGNAPGPAPAPDPAPGNDPGTRPGTRPVDHADTRHADTRHAATRRRAVGWATGVPHCAGVALLAVTELMRTDVGDMGAHGKSARTGGGAGASPEYAHGFAQLHESLSSHGWYRFAELLRDHLGLGEPRAVLWAAVFAAVVVRLNRYGPPRVQLVLSLTAAVYCVPAAVAGIPYLVSAGGYALPFLLTFGMVVVVTSTWCGERAG